MLLRFRMDEQRGGRAGFFPSMGEGELLPFCPLGFGEYVSGSEYFTERDGLASWLLFATISGCGTLRYAGVEEQLTAGKAAVIDCSQYQYYATSGPEPWRFFWMHFSGSAADGMVRLINGDSLRAASWEPSRALELFGQLEELSRTPGRQADFMASLWVHQLLAELAQSVQCGTSARYRDAMREAAEYLRLYLAEPLRVGELAKKSGLSEFYFQRVFHDAIGQPPYEYLTRLRVERARSLLVSTNRSVAEIAALTGYSDARGLIDQFKKRVGQTPAAYRRARREGKPPL